MQLDCRIPVHHQPRRLVSRKLILHARPSTTLMLHYPSSSAYFMFMVFEIYFPTFAQGAFAFRVRMALRSHESLTPGKPYSGRVVLADRHGRIGPLLFVLLLRYYFQRCRPSMFSSAGLSVAERTDADSPSSSRQPYAQLPYA